MRPTLQHCPQRPFYRLIPLLLVSAMSVQALPASEAAADSRWPSYEYEVGGCRYEYKEDDRGYKVEYRCRDHSYGAPDYKYEVEFDGCKYEYEQDRDGYKEEYRCRRDAPRYVAGQGFWPRHHLSGPGVAMGAPFDISGGTCNRELVGQVLGGVTGGALGSAIGDCSDTAAIVGGAIVGLLIGGEIGRTMDRQDHQCVGQVLEHAQAGQPVAWRNPGTGAQYQVTPLESFDDPQGRYCRAYTSLADIGGQRREVTGTACRRPDGTWEITG